MTTCPSGVHYMHLVDHAREYIEDNYKRPLSDRVLRWVLAQILPYPMRFRVALLGAKIGRHFAWLMPDARLRAMLEMAPKYIPPVSRNDDPQSFAPTAPKKMRVALMTGCAQKALNTDINDATIRMLTRLGAEVVVAEGAGCCGALTHHMGKSAQSHATAAKNIPEDVAKNITEIGAALKTAAASALLQTRVTKLIVSCALISVHQNVVGLGRLLEFGIRILVIGIPIRMKLHGDTAICLLDIRVCRRPINPENLVIVTLGHCCLACSCSKGTPIPIKNTRA